jgi:hypothetical protein
MPRLIPVLLLIAVALTISPGPGVVPAASSSRSTTVAPGAAVLDIPDTPAALRERLDATDEEWAVVLPKLQHIAALRDEISAPTDSVVSISRRRMFAGPAGGTSLDAPIVEGARRTRAASREFPFDPQKAPGAGGALLNTIAGGIGRLISDFTRPNRPNSVQTLVTELQTMLDSKDTPGWQLLDKLASIRAARAKAIRELGRAQQDLLPLLTTEQVATLVALGYLD